MSYAVTRVPPPYEASAARDASRARAARGSPLRRPTMLWHTAGSARRIALTATFL